MADVSLIFNIIARDKTSEAFNQVKAGAAAAGAAIGAVLMAGVMAAIDKSRLDNKLAAQLGATPGQAAALGKLSGQVYAAGFGDDMPQVTTAIKDAAQNGLIDIKNASSDASQAATKNLLTVSSVLEEDTARTSAAISQMLRTGLAGSAEEAMDLLVAASQKGVNKSQDLLDTVNEYGAQFQKLGLDGPTSLGLLSQAIQAGARDSDFAADAIKEFSIRAVDGSKLSAKAFKDLGMDAKGMTATFAAGGPDAAAGFDAVLRKLKEIKDPVKQNEIAVALFGTKAEDLGKSLFAMNVPTASKQLGDLKGATGRAAATASQGAASWSALGRQFQMALVDKMNAALPAVNAVMGFMQRNSSWIGPLATGLGVLAIAIGVITVAQWAWNAALAVSPVTWIIAGIVALVAVIVLVATKTRFFQTIWQHVWGFLKGVGAWFAGPFANFFIMLWGKIKAVFTGIKNIVMFVVNGVVAYFRFLWNFYSKIIGWILTKAGQLINFFRSMPGKLGGVLKNLFAPLWNGFKGFVNRIISGWNNLSFTVGGGSFMGIDIPRVTISTPNIPYLATGGRVRQTGLAVVHRGEEIHKGAVVSRTGAGTGTASRGATITIRGDGSRMANLLLELLREAVREKGGDPVKVLTPR